MRSAPAPTPPGDLRLDEVASELMHRASCLSKLLLRRTQLEISRTEAGVLRTLSVRPRRITELATGEVVTQPAMSLLVNRLQDRGWVERTPDPSDRRAVLVALTAAGQDAIDRLLADYGSLLERELSSLPHRDLETLARASEILDNFTAQLAEPPS